MFHPNSIDSGWATLIVGAFGLVGVWVQYRRNRRHTQLRIANAILKEISVKGEAAQKSMGDSWATSTISKIESGLVPYVSVESPGNSIYDNHQKELAYSTS